MAISLLHRIRRAALDLAIPPRCRACDAELDAGDNPPLACRDCLEKFALVDWPACRRCAAALPAEFTSDQNCPHCAGEKLWFDRAFALASYEGRVAELVQRMKEDRAGRLARLFVELAWQRFGGELAALGVDAVFPIPPHGASPWRTGADAPRTLGELLAAKLRAPLAAGGLRLDGRASRQVGLSRVGRFTNMKGRMTLVPSHQVAGTRLLVVDDILTAGATASEAARALKKAGAADVVVFVVGRTPAQDLPHVIH